MFASLPGIPLVKAGDDVAQLILSSLKNAEIALQDGDVLVITSKIISKSEGRRLDLRTISPSARAQEIAAVTDKDPRLVEVALGESLEVARMAKNVLITRHKLGFVSANAGIDHSNVGADGEEWILLLPENPDESAAKLRDIIVRETGAQVAIIISDTHGRPHRVGNVGVAIGVAGLPAVVDLRGNKDLFGRTLIATEIGLADEIAAAADLLSGQAAEGLPVTLMRGLRFTPREGHASEIYRPLKFDLFR